MNVRLFDTPITNTDFLLCAMGQSHSENLIKNTLILNFNRFIYLYRKNTRALTSDKLTSDLCYVLRLLSLASRKLKHIVINHAALYPDFKETFDVYDY